MTHIWKELVGDGCREKRRECADVNMWTMVEWCRAGDS